MKPIAELSDADCRAILEEIYTDGKWFPEPMEGIIWTAGFKDGLQQIRVAMEELEIQ